MSRESLRRVLVFPNRCSSANVFLAMFLVFSLGFRTVSQGSAQGVGDVQHGEIGGEKFAVPAGFQLEPGENHKLAFMRNRSEALGLFVTIAEQQVNDTYLTNLSRSLVTRLRHEEDGFKWKILETSEPRLSRYQTNRGIMKGLKGKVFVQVDYVVVKVKDQDIVIGSIAQFGEERTAPFLFNVEGREYSVPGWQALFQLISSVTGEKDDELR